METINVYLTAPQRTKAKKGIAFQLSEKSFSQEPNMTIKVGKVIAKKAMKLQQTGKGFRLSEGSYECDSCDHNHDEEEGDGLVKSTLKVARTPEGRAVGRIALNRGVAYAEKQGYITDRQATVADVAGTKFIESNYGKPKGDGIKSGRPAKGSQEAKDRMAQIRAMRKDKSGGEIGGKINGKDFVKGFKKGFIGTLKSAVDPKVVIPFLAQDYDSAGTQFAVNLTNNTAKSLKSKVRVSRDQADLAKQAYSGSSQGGSIRVISDNIKGSGFMNVSKGSAMVFDRDSKGERIRGGSFLPY